MNHSQDHRKALSLHLKQSCQECRTPSDLQLQVDKKVLDPSFLLSYWFISHLPHLLIKLPILLQQFHTNLKTAATTLCPLILKFPSPIPGAGAGQSGEGVLPSKSSVPPAPIGGLLPGTLESQIALSATFAEIDKRRLPMALVSKTNSFSTNNASQSLPHWLREFFKPEQTPLPKPATLSPTITGTAEATAFLYNDCETSLPPFVHPGTPPTPPKNFSKRNKRQERNSEGSRVAGELDSVGGSEPVSQTLPNPGLDQLKMQTQFPAALPASLQQFVAGLKSSLTGGGVQPASVPPLSPSFSKWLFDFSTPPPIEPSPQSAPFSMKPSVLAELMALKNLASVSLPLTPPLNRFPLQSVLDIYPIPQLGFSTSDPNLPLENCVQQGERWVHSQDSPYFAVTKHPHHSVIANRELPAVHHHRSSGFDMLASKHGGKAPLIHVHQPRSMEIHSESCALVHKQAGQQQSQTGWILSTVHGAKITQEDVPTSRADLDRNGDDSSSETQSDPLIHGKAHASRHEFHEITSDETISDD
ncbi:unnamed protein product [Sphagnum jensenii]|uniref:Uncharacterized protein n=1 Tax=Sphagnum jensenii TaxID=128206 RepID=A0ABP0W1W4_9BRYO